MTAVLNRPAVRRVAAVTAFLAAGLILPVVVHLIPIQDGPPAGARLLPIFLAPLVALLRLDGVSALSIALLGPLLNRLVTGSPEGSMLATLLVELLAFCGLLLLARRLAPRAAGPLAPVAYLLAAASATAILTGAMPTPAWLTGTLRIAWPGLAILLVAGIAAGHRGRTG